MSDTRRAEKAERTEDERGNPVPWLEVYPIDDSRWEDEDPDEFIGSVYVPKVAPEDERQRNNLVRWGFEEALRRRGFAQLAELAAWMNDDETFDLFAVLSPGYDPADSFATPERDDLFHNLPRECFNDPILTELAHDAFFAMGCGDPDALRFLEDEGEWVEFRVSLRVALTAG